MTLNDFTDAALKDAHMWLHKRAGESPDYAEAHRQSVAEMKKRNLDVACDLTKVAGEREVILYQIYEMLADEFGPFNQGTGADGAHYIPADQNVFAAEGLSCSRCKFWEDGGCEIVSGFVEPDGLCKLWIIPVKDDDDFDMMKATVRKEDERRYTFAPWYVPGKMDAHGEWTDSSELQQALWSYVKSGDRRIRLQHDTNVVAGEWVEAVTWPYEVDLPLSLPDGSTRTFRFPAETVFLGVIWEPWAWERVKSGDITGFSIGGQANRVGDD